MDGEPISPPDPIIDGGKKGYGHVALFKQSTRWRLILNAGASAAIKSNQFV